MNDIEIGPAEIVTAIKSLGLRIDGDYWTEATSLARRIARVLWDDETLQQVARNCGGDPMSFAVPIFTIGLQMGALLASGRFVRATRRNGTEDAS